MSTLAAPPPAADPVLPRPPAPTLPPPRGPLGRALHAHWQTGAPLPPPTAPVDDPLTDDDLHLALWSCYQLHYSGFAEVDDRLEWDPSTLAFRAGLEAQFEGALRAEHPDHPADDPLAALDDVATWAGPPLARTIATRGTLDQLREFAIHRSAYQLKEADAHTWGIPRLAGPGRAAMIEIQADEYGDGVPGQAHAELFAEAMADLGLDPTFGRYVDRLPGVTLATDNLVSMFGLHRRLRGALVGHLALFEMCSVLPMSRYLAAARRLGPLPALERFYAVHVEIDEHHGRLARDQMAAPVVASDPSLGPEVVFGAAALSRCEARLAGHILGAWDRGRSSLRPPTPAPLVVAGDGAG
ncbi:MAG TPA: iron-containing redox enzyme family protein [Acidimicrobiales bacterium]|nr:iron-containing redox enzyme family protein [Acidimicrobiales bacterium]